MDEADAFLKGLDENEDDDELRMVYADWLEELGEYEEAERQRLWPDAKAWLMNFAAEHPEHQPYEDSDWTPTFGISYADLLRLGEHCLESDFVSFGADDGLMEDVASVFDEFMKNWSIVTGVPLPDEGLPRPRFKCAC